MATIETTIDGRMAACAEVRAMQDGSIQVTLRLQIAGQADIATATWDALSTSEMDAFLGVV